jgi:hypothetical protein
MPSAVFFIAQLLDDIGAGPVGRPQRFEVRTCANPSHLSFHHVSRGDSCIQRRPRTLYQP